MPRNNKRNGKIRAKGKKQEGSSKLSKHQNEKQTEFDESITQWEPSKDDGPTTSKNTVSVNSKIIENFEGLVHGISNSSSVQVNNKKNDKGQPSANMNPKKKRKPLNRLICFSDSDDDEPVLGPPTMRYVDVARAAMLGTDKAVQTQKSPNQLLDMGLEEFPFLQPTRYPSSEPYNQRFVIQESDSSVHESDVCSSETDLSDMTERFIMDNEEHVFKDVEKSAEPNSGTNDTLNCEKQCKTRSSGVCCGIDGVSSSGSYWAEGSNDTGSENDENISCTDDGGGDAGYTYDCENECSPEVPQASTFSQEWLDATVRSLALPFGVSIPSFNFLQPDVNFPRFERQFEDAHYERLEDRAIFALRLAQNKSFFRDGNYM